MVCLSTRDRSYNCDSLLMRVYHYLIECLLKYFTYSLIQNRMPFQKRSSRVDLISLEPQYISVGELCQCFLICELVLKFYLKCPVSFLGHVLVNFSHSPPHSEASLQVWQISAIAQLRFLKGNSITLSVLAFAFY